MKIKFHRRGCREKLTGEEYAMAVALMAEIAVAKFIKTALVNGVFVPEKCCFFSFKITTAGI